MLCFCHCYCASCVFVLAVQSKEKEKARKLSVNNFMPVASSVLCLGLGCPFKALALSYSSAACLAGTCSSSGSHCQSGCRSSSAVVSFVDKLDVLINTEAGHIAQQFLESV